MAAIIQNKNTNPINRALKAESIIKETKVLTIARLSKMLIDLFSSDRTFKKIGKRAGKEIELYFKELDQYITFILTSEKNNFECYVERAKNPISKVIITVKEDDVLQVFSKIVRSKNNIFGLIGLLKYIIPGKIKIKGSYFTSLKWVRTLMIGNHKIFKKDI
ncbi:MAG: hypothetical protein ACFE9Q_16645 [Candidatus Hodarchaeota archaeon]